jgi:hypothetical protein
MGERRAAYKVVVEKDEGKRPLGRPKLRWEDSIKIELDQIEWAAGTVLVWLRMGNIGGLL